VTLSQLISSTAEKSDGKLVRSSLSNANISHFKNPSANSLRSQLDQFNTFSKGLSRQNIHQRLAKPSAFGSIDIDAHDSIILEESGVKTKVQNQQAIRATVGHSRDRRVAQKEKTQLSTLFENGLAAAIKKQTKPNT
jgi:hypothetical protein